MPHSRHRQPVRIAILGAGAVSDYHHVPGIRLDPRAELVAACDTNASLLEQRQRDWSIDYVTTDYHQICADPAHRCGDHCDAELHARPHGGCGGRPRQTRDVREAVGSARGGSARDVPRGAAAGIVHMTAFTYRFAPSMRYLKHLLDSGALGTPRHFRSQRFLDLPETSWGWRQYKDKAGAGDLFDMTIHRIDFAIDLLGPIERICGAVARFAPRTTTADGRPCAASEVDDWSSLIGEFACGAVGVWEGTTLAKGYGLNGFGHEWAEINGSEGSAVYRLHEPNTLLLGKTGQDLAPVSVPDEFLSPPDSPRDPRAGVPATVFRYDLVWEFVSAITARAAGGTQFLRGAASPGDCGCGPPVAGAAHLDRDSGRTTLNAHPRFAPRGR